MKTARAVRTFAVGYAVTPSGVLCVQPTKLQTARATLAAQQIESDRLQREVSLLKILSLRVARLETASKKLARTTDRATPAKTIA